MRYSDGEMVQLYDHVVWHHRAAAVIELLPVGYVRLSVFVAVGIAETVVAWTGELVLMGREEWREQDGG